LENPKEFRKIQPWRRELSGGEGPKWIIIMKKNGFLADIASIALLFSFSVISHDGVTYGGGTSVPYDLRGTRECLRPIARLHPGGARRLLKIRRRERPQGVLYL
jgi:hypothetical protein